MSAATVTASESLEIRDTDGNVIRLTDMMNPRNMTLGITLAGLALFGTACYQDPKVEVINSCGETIVFAQFNENDWAPEARDQVFAELQWKKIKAGESIDIEFTGWIEAPTTITVVAEDGPLEWDPIEADVVLEYSEDRDSGIIHLVGDLCGSQA